MSYPAESIKAVFFDVGGVVVKSPLIAIHAYEREKGLTAHLLSLEDIARLKKYYTQHFPCSSMVGLPLEDALHEAAGELIVALDDEGLRFFEKSGDRWLLCLCWWLC